MSAQKQLDLQTETYPQHWIARRCLVWSAAQNQRFRLYRLDGPSDHAGRKPGAVWDADELRWRDQWRLGGICGHELARPAKSREIPVAATAKATGEQP